MLHGLQAYLDGHPSGDILIVLHQMGSHGPAYHKRYPPAFRTFAPTCESSQLDACTEAEIGNTYDNTIRYTDHFLAEVIELLRANDARFETAMVYLSDHGESLGEAGLYLHGLPYLIAPDTQTHVPLILWFGSNNRDVDVDAVRQLRDLPLSHDNLFHTLLGLFEVGTEIYDADKDILQQARLLSGTGHGGGNGAPAR
jgi:lipid A ethanolaminephosphotransferase